MVGTARMLCVKGSGMLMLVTAPGLEVIPRGPSGRHATPGLRHFRAEFIQAI